MSGQTSLFYWDKLPDRDEALETVYRFLRAISQKDTETAKGLVLVKDMAFFERSLHDSLLTYLDMVLEDEQWEEFEDKNLVYEIDDPSTVDEDLSLPEFSGKQFELAKDETISVQLGMHGQITPIRVHFGLGEYNGKYFIKIQRITAK